MQHFFIAHHCRDKLVGNALGISVQQANPLNALYRVECIQQRRNFHRAAVLAKRRQVLRHQNDFLHALLRQKLGFLYHILYGAAAQIAANQRNGAVGAAVVAAFGNFQIGIVGRRGNHTRTAQGIILFCAVRLHGLFTAAHALLDDIYNVLVGCHTHHSIYFGDFRDNFMAVALGKTARYHHFQIRIFLFPGTRL